MEVIHDRSNQEFKIKLDGSLSDKGYLFSSMIRIKKFIKF